MLLKKTTLIAAIAAGSLAAMPAQAFFCSNFFGKSKQQTPPRFLPAYSYYLQQQPYLIPYGVQSFYDPRYNILTIPTKRRVKR